MKKNYRLLLLLSASLSLFTYPIDANAQESDEINDYSASEVLDFSNIPDEVKDSILFHEVQPENEKEYLTDAQVENISVQKFIQVYDELNSTNLLTENTEETNKLVAEKLLEPTQMSAKGYLPQAYEDLTDNEKKLVKSHPIEAVVYYKKSTLALETAASLYTESQLYQGNGDAFRHAFWNAILVKAYGAQSNESSTDEKAGYGVTRASAWTTAHEQNSSGIDKEMDMNNNSVGQYHAYLNFNSSETTLKNNLVKMVSQGQMARIVNGKLTATNSTK